MPSRRVVTFASCLLLVTVTGACAAEGERVVAAGAMAVPVRAEAVPASTSSTSVPAEVASAPAPTTTAAPTTTTTAAPTTTTTEAPPPAVSAPPETTVPPAVPEPAPVAAAPATSFAPAGTWFDGEAEARFLSLTNAERARIGAGQLVRDAGLDAYARGHAIEMMAAGHIYHSDIGSLLGGWWTVGENVGVGPTVQPIQDALLASPPHYENISHGEYLSMGVGVLADSSGRIWTVHVFAA